MLLAYRYQLQMNTVSVMNERANCTLDAQFATRATPLRALFDGEPSARSSAIKRRLLGKINQYALPETMLAQARAVRLRSRFTPIIARANKRRSTIWAIGSRSWVISC
jgi:hypothetical protein